MRTLEKPMVKRPSVTRVHWTKNGIAMARAPIIVEFDTGIDFEKLSRRIVVTITPGPHHSTIQFPSHGHDGGLIWVANPGCKFFEGDPRQEEVLSQMDCPSVLISPNGGLGWLSTEQYKVLSNRALDLVRVHDGMLTIAAQAGREAAAALTWRKVPCQCRIAMGMIERRENALPVLKAWGYGFDQERSALRQR